MSPSAPALRRLLPIALGLALPGLAAPVRAQFHDFAGWTGFDLATPAEMQFGSAFELADLDGDGHLDLALVSWGLTAHKLAILRDLGDGSFGPATFLPLANGSQDLALGDIDGDGDLDAAVTEGGNTGSGNTVALFANDGNAGFTLAQRLTVGTGPWGIAAGDFDGDGDTDFGVALYGLVGSGTSVKRLVNGGTGSFTVGPATTVATGPSAVAAGDLDGDGRDDLAVGHEKTDTITILRSTGSGFAAQVLNVGAGTAGGSHLFPALDLVDLDLDGDLDVAFSDNSHQKFIPLLRGIVAVLLNQGGSFVVGPDIVLRPGASGFTDLAFAELNGDGWPDLLGVDRQDWDFSLSDGQGGYVQPTQVNYGFLATDEPVAVGTCDADRDGDADAVVLGSHSMALSIHRFAAGAPLQGLAYPGVDGDLDAADIDGDGDLDIAGGGGGSIGVLRNAGDGSFGPAASYASGAFGGPKAVLLRDLDGDRLPDLVIGALSGFNTRLNLGNGTFGALTTWSLPICGLDDLDLADFDEDGDLDVVIPESLGCPSVPFPRVWIVEGLGDGDFVQPAGPTFLSDGLTAAVAHADLDGDGHQDLVLAQNSWLEVHLGHGDLGFGPSLQAPVGWAPHDIAVADFDGDGVLDLASCNWGSFGNNFSDESLTVVAGHGDGTFGPPQLLPANVSWDLGSAVAVQAADFDRDADIDLAVANFDSHDVSLYRNAGDGSFVPAGRAGGALYLTDIVLDDFTGDGVPDLALAGQPAALTVPGIVLLQGLGDDPWMDVAPPLAGAVGLPHLDVDGALVAGNLLQAQVDKALPGGAGTWVVGLAAVLAPFKGGVLAPSPDLLLPFAADAQGTASLAAPLPVALPSGTPLVLQAWLADGAAPHGLSATSGMAATAP